MMSCILSCILRSLPNENCGVTADGDGPAALGTAGTKACKTQGAALHPQFPLSSALLSETVES